MNSTIERAILTVPDISCAHCVATVRQAVGHLAGIQLVEANADTKRVDVAFHPNQSSLARIEQALDDAGYPVQK